MKVFLKNLWNLVKQYYFIGFAILALYVPELLMRSVLGEPFFTESYVPWVHFLFNLGWVFLFITLSVFVLPKILGKIVFSIISVLSLALGVSQYVYFKIFEQYFWLRSIALASEASDYTDYVMQMIDAPLIISIVLAIAFLVLALVFWKHPETKSKKRYLSLLFPFSILLITHLSMQPLLHGDNTHQWNTWAQPRTVYRNFTDANKGYEITGMYQYAFMNAYSSWFPRYDYDEENLEKADYFFAEKGESPKNAYTNLFKGKNVIAVMMESIDTWCIDPKTTPTLYKMMNNGINFTEYYAPFFGAGFTFSSEFAFNTGFFAPSAAGSASNFSTNTFPYATARLFADEGYACNSFHFNNPEFYNRGIMHKSFGFERYHSLSDFGITGTEAELDSNILSDELYAKMTEKTPFYNFIITYSAHLPYSGASAKLDLAKEYRPDLIDETINEEKNNMQILAADTDTFFAELLQRLEDDNLLNDTVIICYTDHFAYGISDEEMLLEWKGEGLKYRVPAFIYNPNLRPVTIDKPMMTIDWAPTMVNLFGLNRDSRYIGNDVLEPTNKGFAFFENWGWADDTMTYFPSEADQANPEDLAHITAQNQRVRDSITIGDAIILSDYYKKTKKE